MTFTPYRPRRERDGDSRGRIAVYPRTRTCCENEKENMMSEDQMPRRVPAQLGWIIEYPYKDPLKGGESIVRWAVVEWEYDADRQNTRALCMGPLGHEDFIQLHELDLTGAGTEWRVRPPAEFGT
jgi:hypothetical protein